MSFRLLNNITGWLVFLVAAVILGKSAEPTGSLWDCGEFISGAYKLQVVHPPGAPLFLLVGRMFTWVAEMVSDNKETIAYSVNLLSALCTAFTAMFVCWSTTILAKMSLVGRADHLDKGQTVATIGAGLVAGLTTGFLPSLWFSAAEGEVYAMSTFFTAMTIWAVLKWYQLPDTAKSDKWLIFAVYSAGLSIGVHLLSLLTFPALALLYYFKKTEKPTPLGALGSAILGVVFIGVLQTIVIVGIPKLWASFDFMMVNSFGLPFNSGLIPLILLFGGVLYFGLNYAAKTGNRMLQQLVTAFFVSILAYTSFGTVVIRANANPPINMNDPSDPMRLLPYLNREQYGERPLVSGPDFDAKPYKYDFTERYGQVDGKYEIVDEKIDPVYRGSDKKLFPRLGDYSQGRPRVYREWIGKPNGKLTLGDNIEYFFRYQFGWMYWRYFMWNFSGRQNGTQGYSASDVSSGNWISGIDAYDSMRLGNLDKMTDEMKNDPARNTYYMIPFFLGLLGLFYHAFKSKKEFLALFALFLITGVGIIVYSNQPPNEPRERDYVLVGSFFVYAMWIGLSVVAIYELLASKVSGMVGGLAGVAIGLVVPVLLVSQNWDDYSRQNHYGARDYASNFLESCEKNAIIFTYGDNDTYPLWYAQEVEGIRTDIRVVNLSLIAVDWYIDQMRRTVNNSPAIKFSIPSEQIRGFKRVQIPAAAGAEKSVSSLSALMAHLATDKPMSSQMSEGHGFDTYLPATNLFLPVDKAAVVRAGLAQAGDPNIVDTMRFSLGERNALIKDDLAILDIIHSNLWDRPIYWAVTCREEKFMGLESYMQLEGLALRLVPFANRSDDGYGVVGNGKVDTDRTYNNIMTKWRWGNFDNIDTHINTSYGPSLQTMRIVFIRTARKLLANGEKEKAIALAEKYFTSFPSKNFPYDYFSTYLLDVLVKAGAPEKAAPIMKEMADYFAGNLTFYESQPDDIMKSSFQQDYQMSLRSAMDIQKMATDGNMTEVSKYLNDKFATWKPMIDQMMQQQMMQQQQQMQQQLQQQAPPAPTAPKAANQPLTIPKPAGK
jgi:Protein of unknown function (DUF2723)